MSRQSSAPRALSLPEELEKLEQSITLTLQEIDSNFSKAHRIVTGSILPIVEQYAKHSNAVWDGSKFWKQFFEASANVSLSGYEDDAHADESNLETTETETSATLQTPTDHDDRTTTDAGAHASDEEDEFSTMNSPTQVTGVQTTPRLASASRHPSNSVAKPSTSTSRPTPSSTFRSPSPRKYTGRNPLGSTNSPSTPHAPAAASSPFEPESGFQPSAQPSTRRNHHNTDTLLHRGVLDKNYRIQATPHTQRRARQQQQQQQQQQQAQSKTQATPATATRTGVGRALWEDSPGSSPEISAPQLRSELFSPVKKEKQPRTPGVSVLTPGHRNLDTGDGKGLGPTTSTGRALFSTTNKTNPNTPGTGRASYLPYSSDEESDEGGEGGFGGMSPPKTMQFHIPQSRLVQTPAREASKRIVEDLLATAGADEEDDEDEIDFDAGGFRGGYGGEEEEESPSVVRRGFDVDEDTF